jgi:hypothetical protein
MKRELFNRTDVTSAKKNQARFHSLQRVFLMQSLFMAALTQVKATPSRFPLIDFSSRETILNPRDRDKKKFPAPGKKYSCTRSPVHQGAGKRQRDFHCYFSKIRADSQPKAALAWELL